MDKLNPWYIAGFCDGECTFTYSRSGNHIALYFAVKLTEKDYKLLYAIKDFFGVGKIYYVQPRAPTKNKNSGYTKSSFYYRVSKLFDLERVIDFFDKYPLKGLKVESYKIWREMVLLKRQNYRRKQSQAELDNLAAQLSATTVRNQPWA